MRNYRFVVTLQENEDDGSTKVLRRREMNRREVAEIFTAGVKALRTKRPHARKAGGRPRNPDIDRACELKQQGFRKEEICRQLGIKNGYRKRQLWGAVRQRQRRAKSGPQV